MIGVEQIPDDAGIILIALPVHHKEVKSAPCHPGIQLYYVLNCQIVCVKNQ